MEEEEEEGDLVLAAPHAVPALHFAPPPAEVAAAAPAAAFPPSARDDDPPQGAGLPLLGSSAAEVRQRHAALVRAFERRAVGGANAVRGALLGGVLREWWRRGSGAPRLEESAVVAAAERAGLFRDCDARARAHLEQEAARAEEEGAPLAAWQRRRRAAELTVGERRALRVGWDQVAAVAAECAAALRFLPPESPAEDQPAMNNPEESPPPQKLLGPYRDMATARTRVEYSAWGEPVLRVETALPA